MPIEGEVLYPDKRTLPLTWLEGFRLYMHDPHAKSLLRFVLRWAPLLLPATIITDILTPIIGPLAVVDNALYWPLLIAAIVTMLWKVRQYRYHPSAADLAHLRP
ncbi:MAG TPA: hypothetical protein VK978_03025 [Candidatus Saccharimonadales bacterium]|nr:hypothetical protein [Candidatus Saccharimonadales bacterium]